MRTSFLIPVYNPDLSVLRLCVNSALKAASDQHEVIIVDDASSRDEIREFLQSKGIQLIDKPNGEIEWFRN